MGGVGLCLCPVCSALSVSANRIIKDEIIAIFTLNCQNKLKVS